MKFKKDDSKYSVRFMRATEEIINSLSVEEFITYLVENAELEDEINEYIDGNTVECKVYDLVEENSNLHKEFLVTNDGRLYYWFSLNEKVELVDDCENRKEIKGMKKYYCVTSAFDDRGRTTANITRVIEAEEKPLNTYTRTRRKDVYNDWYETKAEAKNAIKEVLNA